MDAKRLLEELLQTGRDMASKGQSAIEKKLDIEAPGEKRDATISGIKTGALAAGVMALLVGTKSGRKLTGSALKLGSLAAVGGIAWQAYKNWSAAGAAETANEGKSPVLPVDKLDESAANDRSLTLLKAMIAAAKADGHIDASEMADINQKIADFGLSGDIAGFVQAEIASPTTPVQFAELAENPETAAEIYLISSMLIDQENALEKAYLDDLVAALELPADLLAELEKAKAAAVA
ncbi:MAG: tellurite resistance TerB family protein [Leucothrix sp.]